MTCRETGKIGEKNAIEKKREKIGASLTVGCVGRTDQKKRIIREKAGCSRHGMASI